MNPAELYFAVRTEAPAFADVAARMLAVCAYVLTDGNPNYRLEGVGGARDVLGAWMVSQDVWDEVESDIASQARQAVFIYNSQIATLPGCDFDDIYSRCDMVQAAWLRPGWVRQQMVACKPFTSAKLGQYSKRAAVKDAWDSLPRQGDEIVPFGDGDVDVKQVEENSKAKIAIVVVVALLVLWALWGAK